MKTFSVQTLGCKVNQYESEQLAAFLRGRGLCQTSPALADLRVVNTCSVTVEAVSKSRQAARRAVRLPVLGPQSPHRCHSHLTDLCSKQEETPSTETSGNRRARVVITGCWATSDRAAAESLPNIDAVITHHEDVAAELDRLLRKWQGETAPATTPLPGHSIVNSPPEPVTDDPIGWIIEAGLVAGESTTSSKSAPPALVNGNIAAGGDEDDKVTRGQGDKVTRRRGDEERTTDADASPLTLSPPHLVTLSSSPSPVHLVTLSSSAPRVGTTALPLLSERQPGRQRALLKVQDGCDAHCTYCIIPRLRPGVWSKPVEDVVTEATALVAAGHVEVVLNGIFLGAYGQRTALRRRQPDQPRQPLADLVEALCTRVPGLGRVRLSSLEPGDLTDDLLAVLRSHRQVVPHFHLPLQSGSDLLLRRMNRQYTRDDFRRMIARVREAFDRPALTTDVIVGFPGETDEEFNRTLEIADEARFIHTHAFPYSPRPGTAAARWGGGRTRGDQVHERMERLRTHAAACSLSFRRSFLGQPVELLVEREAQEETGSSPPHGRCERYFDVAFVHHPPPTPGDLVRVRVDEIRGEQTLGTFIGFAGGDK